MDTDEAITAEQVIAALRAHEAELRAAGIRALSLFGRSRAATRGRTVTSTWWRSSTQRRGWT